MTFLPSGWRGWRRIWQRAPEREVDAEVAFHLDERTAELTEGGMTADAARCRAEAEFGDVAAVRGGLVAIDTRLAERRSLRERWEWLGQDVRYVWRSLRRSPGFVVAVALTLALGLGANAAVISVLNRLFVQVPPGIEHPESLRRLHRFYRMGPGDQRLNRDGGDFSVFTLAELHDLVAAAPPRTRLGAFMTEKLPLEDAPDAGTICFVFGDYFRMLGVHAEVGRFFAPDEMRVEVPNAVAVISHTFWRTHFAGRPDVVGQSIEVNRHRYTIIGVAGNAFHGATNDAADLWLPISEMHWIEGMRGDSWFRGNFRIPVLVAGESAASFPAIELAATQIFRHDGLSQDSNAVAQLDPLMPRTEPGGGSQEVAIVTRLAGVSLIILLIACANVTNLMLARSTRRRRELAVRLALGIQRRRLVVLLLAESVTVAAIGGAIAVAVAWPGATALRNALMPQTHWVDPAVDPRLLMIIVSLTAASGIGAGLVPALRASRPDVTAVLKGGVDGQTTRTTRLRNAMLIGQVALSVLLLAGAGLFVRSLHSIETEDIGYDVDRLAFATVAADPDHPERRADIAVHLPAAAQRIRELSGVEGVALASNIPMRDSWAASLFLPSRDSLLVGVSFVSPEYLTTIGVRLLQGSGLNISDHSGSVTAVLVNQSLARRLWPGRAAVGQCVIQRGAGNPCSTVVGVVADAHEMTINEAPTMRFYAPLADTGTRNRARILAVRTAPGQSAFIAARVRRILDEEFGGWAVPTIEPMKDNLRWELHPWRVGAALFSAAGVLALLVAMVGIYSTISYTFSQRTREMGIRVALGARSHSVVRLVVGTGVRVVVIGVAIGLALALAAGRLVESMLYHTSARDPLVLATVSGFLLGVAALACLVPAWRAVRVDPVVALRAD